MLNTDLNNVNVSEMDWETWKQYLKQAMEFAGELGVPRDKIQAMAGQVGNILAENVTPVNDEQKAVKELWEVANESERQVLANLMTKLVSQQNY